MHWQLGTCSTGLVAPVEHHSVGLAGNLWRAASPLFSLLWVVSGVAPGGPGGAVCGVEDILVGLDALDEVLRKGGGQSALR